MKEGINENLRKVLICGGLYILTDWILLMIL